MLTFDQFEFKEKFETLGFVDFMEALTRVADFLNPPPAEEVAELGFDSAYTWHVAVRLL
jgi:hypothetical protein